MNSWNKYYRKIVMWLLTGKVSPINPLYPGISNLLHDLSNIIIREMAGIDQPNYSVGDYIDVHFDSESDWRPVRIKRIEDGLTVLTFHGTRRL
jgi:hypothetical protein